MKLSDAIALGRMLVNPVPYAQDDGRGGGCALGMAARAAGLNTSGYYLVARHQPEFPIVDADAPQILPCGHECATPSTIADAIVHLFNTHVCGDKTWTLDQLIDWVRSVEPREPVDLPKPVPAPPAEQHAEALETVPGPNLKL